MAKTAAERQRDYREKAKAERLRLHIVVSRLAGDSLKYLMDKSPQLSQQDIIGSLIIEAAAMQLDEILERRMLSHEYYCQLKERSPEEWIKAFRAAKSAVTREGRSMEEISMALDKHLAVMLKKQQRIFVTK